MPKLLLEFLKDPNSIGAIVPSSRALAKKMVKAIEIEKRHNIIELGPGTGPMTAVINEKLQPHQKYLGIDINQSMINNLKIKFPQRNFICGSVENIRKIADANGMKTADAIVCSLPWALLPIRVQLRCFAALRNLCPPGSVFVTFAYLQGIPLPGGRALKALLASEFKTVKTSSVVWRNIPPAVVYICQK